MRLQARELVSGYRKSEVLHGVNFDLAEGELVAVLGANGAGKSTLMKTLARTIPVMHGDLTLDGQTMRSWRAHRAVAAGVGYVPQEHNVFADLSVADNLALADRAGDCDALARVYERFPILAERNQQSAGSLSGGERQALAVSMAILGRPRILLLDEPTTGLAPQAADNLTNWIVEIAVTGVSVAWVVEQNPEPVLAAAQRAYVLAGGSIQYAGPAAEISADRALSLDLDQHETREDHS